VFRLVTSHARGSSHEKLLTGLGIRVAL
jgi:hypothetical protein